MSSDPFVTMDADGTMVPLAWDQARDSVRTAFETAHPDMDVPWEGRRRGEDLAERRSEWERTASGRGLRRNAGGPRTPRLENPTTTDALGCVRTARSYRGKAVLFHARPDTHLGTCEVYSGEHRDAWRFDPPRGWKGDAWRKCQRWGWMDGDGWDPQNWGDQNWGCYKDTRDHDAWV